MPYKEKLASIETIIDDAKQGKMFILVDDESRENEGDLIIPGVHAGCDSINFMATHGRGLICLAMERERVETLQLPLMSPFNSSRHQTAFTVSIEAREGVTTGISAADRAQTIKVAIDPEKAAADICSPGHIFPLVARTGGVLVRAGHTEAAVDIARLAGLNPSGVICEIMNEDGTMARLPDLVPFAEKHGLNIATIADLISYRRRYDRLVQRKEESTITSQYGGDFNMIVYRSTIEGVEHIALIKGDIDTSSPVLVRMHAIDVLSDVVGDCYDGRNGHLHGAMEYIASQGQGVVIILRDARKQSVSDVLQRREDKTLSSLQSGNLRDYGIGAQILLDLGVKEMTLLTNSKRMVVGLEGYGLTIDGYCPIPDPTE